MPPRTAEPRTSAEREVTTQRVQNFQAEATRDANAPDIYGRRRVLSLFKAQRSTYFIQQTNVFGLYIRYIIPTYMYICLFVLK